MNYKSYQPQAIVQSPLTTLTSRVHASRITRHIWIGDEDAALDRKILDGLNIRAIVNCTEHVPNKWSDIDYINVTVGDPGPNADANCEDFEKMCECLMDTAVFMLSAVRRGRNVLVHCRSGKQRSAFVVLYYLWLHGYRWIDSYKIIKNKRRVAFQGGVNFLPVIHTVEGRSEHLRIRHQLAHLQHGEKNDL